MAAAAAVGPDGGAAVDVAVGVLDAGAAPLTGRATVPVGFAGACGRAGASANAAAAGGAVPTPALAAAAFAVVWGSTCAMTIPSRRSGSTRKTAGMGTVGLLATAAGTTSFKP
ncbi:MAG: hypothetical protein EA356_10810 [Geminicoccaceae bacterium]|nr:MAG: hypothetical protein EA356_10810 [Geminicoccaceae bacterium]